MEENLLGGNSSTVVRNGDTVLREAGAWSGQVQRLLGHLRASGILEVPEALGFDDQGREVLSFLPGQVGLDPLPEALRGEELLVSAAQLLRRIHDASQELVQACPDGWRVPARPPLEVICHGDFAPYNCVYQQGRLSGVIDFDHAHPGSRAWDLAYALYRFAPITHPSNPDGYGTLAAQCRRVGLFCEAYRPPDRSQLAAAIRARLQYMADYLRQGAANGDARLLANIEAGHLAIYENDLAYFDAHRERFEQALNGSFA